VTTFSARVLQNEFLPAGGTVVHAIAVIAAHDDPDAIPGWRVGADAVEVIMLDCSGSMASPATKIQAAHTATCKAIDKLREGTWFAIVAGTSFARLVYPHTGVNPETDEPIPCLAQASSATRAAAKEAVSALRPNGGTSISHWLRLARDLFETRPGGIHHALLLTDGRNESEEAGELAAELQQCVGKFQCDCRGVGTDWDKGELQSISDALLGSTDIIPYPWQMDDEFEAIMEQSMGKQVGAVQLRVLTPMGGSVQFLKQVSPEVQDLTRKVSWQQPAPGGTWRSVESVDPALPLVSVYATGAWGGGDEREYHVCVTVPPQEIGEEYEVRAARVSLVVDGRPAAQVPVRAIWTDDAELSARIDRAVAHYTGQEELARTIEEGLAARREGDLETATHKLGRAAQLAHEASNQATTRLLKRVVEIEDVERGTVKLRTDVTKEDEMTLDTRSRKTVRLYRAQER
jgi:hypothetical protein